MNPPDTSILAPRKFVALNSREALRQARLSLGEGALVLASRSNPDGGYEVVAMPESETAVLVAAAAPARTPPPAGPDSVLSELHSMRSMLEEQLSSVLWSDQQRRDPIRARLLRTMLGAGFSARLSKALLEKLPAGQSYADGLSFVRAELLRAVPVHDDEDGMLDRGGVYALVGPTGVGKTTTTAKLAARCVMRFGPEKLALVTTDGYRIGAYEQLRIYGQILGVPVYAVKDSEALQAVLAQLEDKQMVLVDTVGMSQRDRSVSEQIAMLCSAGRPVKRLLLLNAAAHGDTLNEVVYAYQQAGEGNRLDGCIFTKLDEACVHGALLDTVIRHRLPVYYLSDGQKVPENLATMDPARFIDSVLQGRPAGSLFTCEALPEGAPAVDAADEVANVKAQAERLRQQYQRLIRAMAHDTDEMTAAAHALQAADIGFPACRSLWSKAESDAVSTPAVLDDLSRIARSAVAAECESYVLALCGRSRPDPNEREETYDVESALLVSDRTGAPLAAPNQWLAMPGDATWGARQVQWLHTQDLGKPRIYLLPRIAPAADLVACQEQGVRWVARAAGTSIVIDPASGDPVQLSRLQPCFGAEETVSFKGSAARRSNAEMQVLVATANGTQLPLRCVFSRTVAAESGKDLQQLFVLSNVPHEVDASCLLQWHEWAARLEGCFRLTAKGLALLGGIGDLGDPSMMKRLLTAGQVATTVWRLLQLESDAAQRTRILLAELTGRQARPDRQSGKVVFEGLVKLIHLLDALPADAAGPRTAGTDA